MCKKNDSAVSFGLGLLAGVAGGVVAALLLSPKSGKENREILCSTISNAIEKYSPEVSEAKKQAMESVDLLKYKLERQYKKFSNMIKSKKMRKAKELEEVNDYDFM